MDIDTVFRGAYFDLLGSDLYIDDILYKLTLKCPFGKKSCSIKEIEDLKDVPLDKREFYIMNMCVEKKLSILSSHYHCYNLVLKGKI